MKMKQELSSGFIFAPLQESWFSPGCTSAHTQKASKRRRKLEESFCYTSLYFCSVTVIYIFVPIPLPRPLVLTLLALLFLFSFLLFEASLKKPNAIVHVKLQQKFKAKRRNKDTRFKWLTQNGYVHGEGVI